MSDIDFTFCFMKRALCGEVFKAGPMMLNGYQAF